MDKYEEFDVLKIKDLSSNKLSAGFFVIIPTLAEYILDNLNKQNRKISDTKVSQTCSDINSGHFLINGESVIFDKNGNLIDGQHRLTACRKTGKAIVSLCAFGIDPEAVHSIDVGKSRGPGDIVQMSGIPNGNSVSAIARLLISYQNNNGATIGRPGEISTAQIIEFINSNDRLIEAERWAAQYQASLYNICTRTVLASARLILEDIYGPNIVNYLHMVASGENIANGDPAFAVRRRLFGTRTHKAAQLEAIFRGAIAYAHGRSLSSVVINNTFPAMRGMLV